MPYHLYPIRVYQEDVDAGGIVYHSNYLKYAERARTEWLRDKGFLQSKLKAENNCHFVVIQITAAYKIPAHLDDELEVRSDSPLIKGIRLIMSQKIFKQQRLCVDILVTLALINKEGRPLRLPSSILKISQR